jgi:hypothetical protein
MNSWHASMDAEDAFRDAQMAVAKIDARDMNELALKACLSVVYDKARSPIGRNVAVIGYSVALNLISLQRWWRDRGSRKARPRAGICQHSSSQGRACRRRHGAGLLRS